MNKREIWVLIILIVVLISINVVNYSKRENLKKSHSLLVEDGTIQISINEAIAAEFEDLPGIGPVLAKRIVEYRRVNGGFKKLEGLKSVQGIGDKIFQKILPYIKL
ncbi:MAG: helix-hairpin-helix domain-containing protein [candidate division WOR-3 bacterium]|nr:MAG: helix-hairpin-helix domain-containing protein [candidate division WOR-3 bacterium]